MKKTIAILFIASLLIATVVWYKKTSDYQPLQAALIVGTSADFPPLSFRDNTNAITGFDIDVVKGVAQRLGMDIHLQDQPFAMLLPQLQLGRIHMIAAGMTPTPEREKNIIFTKPYLTSNPLVVITRKESQPLTNLEDLKGKNVIVNTGYTADLYMSKLPDITLIRLPKVEDAFAALDQEKAYAFVTADLTIKPYIPAHKRDNYNFFRIPQTDEQVALALSKKLPADFILKVQKALDAMETDGTLAALKQKWEIAW